MAVLLNPRPCRYHSLILFSVLFRVKSNMNKMATASLQTSGNMLTNSLCPPKSQMENVISVLRIEIVFSIKLTPAPSQSWYKDHCAGLPTQGLNVIFIPASLDIFDHQTRLANLGIPNHSDFDHNTALVLLLRLPILLLVLTMISLLPRVSRTRS